MINQKRRSKFKESDYIMPPRLNKFTMDSAGGGWDKFLLGFAVCFMLFSGIWGFKYYYSGSDGYVPETFFDMEKPVPIKPQPGLPIPTKIVSEELPQLQIPTLSKKQSVLNQPQPYKLHIRQRKEQFGLQPSQLISRD